MYDFCHLMKVKVKQEHNERKTDKIKKKQALKRQAEY